MLKPASAGGSTIKVKKPSIPHVTPPPPPPVHQPVVKTPSFDQSRNGSKIYLYKIKSKKKSSFFSSIGDNVLPTRHFTHQAPRLPPREPPPPPPSNESKPKLGQPLSSSIGLISSSF
jgi:hypothetical protein